MNFELKIRFVILDPFLPSIPSRGVVAYSPLFNFGGGKFRLCSSMRILPFLRKCIKGEIVTIPRGVRMAYLMKLWMEYKTSD
jgi:hypothetical protein